MATTVLTTEDLQAFKVELLQELKILFNKQSGSPTKKWLRSPEVKEMLGVSSGTLQNLRINGTIAYTKMGGMIYYDHDEILKVLAQNRIQNKF